MGTLGRAIYTVEFWIRETLQALDRLGYRLQGNYYFQEKLSRNRTLMNLFDKAPLVDKDAFVEPSASIIGDVPVGRASSIWYGCVLRGQLLVHVAKSNLTRKVLPTIIGENVIVVFVYMVVIVEDEAFIGMGQHYFCANLRRQGSFSLPIIQTLILIILIRYYNNYDNSNNQNNIHNINKNNNSIKFNIIII
ncbi:hypothetical protein K2173_003226 [Erythroxylum novogranatense]|uniref:Uncharacterized protein n=1 Tax=Erythroxylum novogranatense TaxID=1862640 RepID=A0AAV8SY80_9ROSI|nr:hypothetical protein K2173_003226 [Erythroxylum novogranatense]